jgi:hypothetical protein
MTAANRRWVVTAILAVLVLTGVLPAPAASDGEDVAGFSQGRKACANVRLDLVKLTNGADANVAPGPTIARGAAVTWTFNVTNRSQDRLTNIRVLDMRLMPSAGPVVTVCTIGSLAPGQTVTCKRNGVAVAGQHKNLGKAEGYCGKIRVRDGDYSHYYGK